MADLEKEDGCKELGRIEAVLDFQRNFLFSCIKIETSQRMYKRHLKWCLSVREREGI